MIQVTLIFRLLTNAPQLQVSKIISFCYKTKYRISLFQVELARRISKTTNARLKRRARFMHILIFRLWHFCNMGGHGGGVTGPKKLYFPKYCQCLQVVRYEFVVLV
jgi:hypothetical protein